VAHIKLSNFEREPHIIFFKCALHICIIVPAGAGERKNVQNARIVHPSSHGRENGEFKDSVKSERLTNRKYISARYY
jgi:hypothetical protein